MNRSRSTDERAALRKALRDLLKSEYMVTCDWAPREDREVFLKQARSALRWRKRK